VAGLTSKIKLGTGVMILPQRHPLYVAKEIATLDLISPDRVILGIGSGWCAERAGNRKCALLQSPCACKNPRERRKCRRVSGELRKNGLAGGADWI
jgi:hypothetical protein